jgi:hypothetical protein
MQLARNLFLTPRKTYFRKYMEALIALEMDLVMPKDRILELYLNYIEWGKGIFGIGAASSHYYGAGVGALGLDELRRLVTIITNPLRYDVQTFYRSAQMAQRYAFLESRFPDPSAEPAGTEEPGGTERVAPVPDAPVTELQQSAAEPLPAAAGPPAPAESSPSAPAARQGPPAAPEAKTSTAHPETAAP